MLYLFLVFFKVDYITAGCEVSSRSPGVILYTRKKRLHQLNSFCFVGLFLIEVENKNPETHRVSTKF